MKKFVFLMGMMGAAFAAWAGDAWLKSGDSQYVNTGYFMNQRSRIEVDFQFTTKPTQNLLFGAWDAGAKLCAGCWVTGDKFAFLLNDNGYASYSTIAADMVRHTAVIDVPTKSYTMKDAAGAVQATGTIAAGKTLNEPVAVWPVVLFGAASNATGQGKQASNMLIYGVKIYEDGVLVHDYRPCLKIDEPCFRDHVGGGFIYRHGKRLAYGGDIERIPASANTLRILPMGDSITQGAKSGATSGYRGFLWKKLRDAGYSVDYVGSYQADPGSRVDLDGMDVDHEGHGGWRIDTKNGGSGLAEKIPTWFSKFDAPHVVLLHIGTNDSGNDFSDVMTRMGALLDKIYAAAPSTHVVLSTLLWRGTAANYTRIQEYNAALPQFLADQQALGRAVSLVDMHGLVASDATTGAANLDPDLLHPNATGYELMANAWLAEIQRLFPDPSAAAPAAAPALVTTVAQATGDGVAVTVYFNQTMDAAALAAPANYTLGSVHPARIVVSEDGKNATLFFPDVTTAQPQTFQVQNLASAAGAALAATTATVTRPVATISPEACVPVSERSKYRLVYEWNPYSPAPSHWGYARVPVHYVADYAKGIPDGSFKRVAYWFETVDKNGQHNWVWASVDAFTDDAAKVGFPTKRSGAVFQKKVANLKYWSNKAELNAENGRTVDEGNIEFWPESYSTSGMLGLGGNDSKYDFDDKRGSNSYGSMQLHDFKSKLTLFGINQWESSEILFMGVGTNLGAGHPDWVESYGFKNTEFYTAARLCVYVEEAPADATPLELLSVSSDQGGDRIVLAFSREVAEQDFAKCVTVDGASVKDIVRDAVDPTHVIVSVGPATAAEVSVTVQGVRDASPAAHLLTGSVTKTVTAAQLPAEVEEHVPADYRADYELLYSLEIPVEGYASGAAPYTLARRDYPKSFDRIAYYLEIVKDNGTRNWVWSSLDVWTQDADRIAVPDTAARSQKSFLATNLDVASNVAGVQTGRSLGNASVEFWYEGYGVANSLGLEGANASQYDFDDTRTSGNFGSMQIHNVAEKKTVWAYNAFGRGFGYWAQLGIGPNTTGTGHPDWTYSAGNTNWSVVGTTRRVLHVMVRPAAKAARAVAPATVLGNVDEAKDYSLLYVADIPVSKMAVQTPANWTAYHSTDNRALLSGVSVARVGYYLELVDKSSGATTWAWTSFDAFTQNLQDLTFPTNKNFQQTVAHLNVRSNVPGVQTGDDLAGGSIEFISGSFGKGGALGLPGASASAYDWDDTITGGYWGCFQVNNWQARQTIFSVTATTKTDTTVGLGIGNRSTGEPDWTFANNAGNYSARRLYVLVKEGPKPAAVPKVVHAVAEKGGARICVEFDVAVPSALLDASLYFVEGAEIAAVIRSPLDDREVYVTLKTPAAAGTALTLGVYVPGTSAKCTRTVMVPDGALPALFDGVAEKVDYTCIYKYAIPNSSCTATHGGAYTMDESRFHGFAFDRVAYALHLVDKNGAVKWAWASMDTFTGDAGKLGVPCTRRNSWQLRTVDNLSVRYGWSGGEEPDLRAGDFPSGSLEFVYGGHSPGTSLGLPGGSETFYDFDDNGFSTSPSHYSTLQIHDYLGKKTVIALGSLGGGSDTSKPSIGIGNCPVPGAQPDWTFHENADTYTVKDLYVLVRPVASGSGPVIVGQPKSGRAKPRESLTLAVNAPAAVAYQWRKNGVAIPGAQAAVLEVGAEKPETADYDVVVYGADGRSTLSASAHVEISSGGTLFIVR